MWHQRELEKKRDKFYDGSSFRASCSVKPLTRFVSVDTSLRGVVLLTHTHTHKTSTD